MRMKLHKDRVQDLRILLAFYLIFLAACAGSGPAAAPMVPATPSPSTSPGIPTQTPTLEPTSLQPAQETVTDLSARIKVGEYQLYIHCRGTGSPTVILEAGWGDTSDTWSLVQPEVARFTRTCAYDRVGLGRSDPGPEPETYLDAVSDLHALLVNAQVKGPYILVGHSLGGMYMLLYTHEYPDEVVGLVLVDSSHPDSFERNLAVMPTESPTDSESMRFYREWFSSTAKDPTLKSAYLQSGSLGDLPLVVLTAPDKQRADDSPAALSAQFDQIWLTLHEELALLSSNSTHIIVSGSDHFIQQDQPESVITAIRSLIESAQ